MDSNDVAEAEQPSKPEFTDHADNGDILHMDVIYFSVFSRGLVTEVSTGRERK